MGNSRARSPRLRGEPGVPKGAAGIVLVLAAATVRDSVGGDAPSSRPDDPPKCGKKSWRRRRVVQR